MLGSFSTCGTIEIVKQAEPASGTVFSYTTTGGSPLGGGFTLNPPSSTTKTFTDVKKGNYSVTESSPRQAGR